MKKIAVPLRDDNFIDDHFGHCSFYKIFTISDNNEIKEEETLQTEQGCGCKSGIAAELSAMGVNLMLAGGIGSGAVDILNRHNIEVVRGCSGYAESVVKAYLEGKVTDNGVVCEQHQNRHGHQCDE